MTPTTRLGVLVWTEAVAQAFCDALNAKDMPRADQLALLMSVLLQGDSKMLGDKILVMLEGPDFSHEPGQDQ